MQHSVLYQRVCACGGEALRAARRGCCSCGLPTCSRQQPCCVALAMIYGDGSATTTAHSGHPPRPRRPPPPRSPPPRQPRPQRGGGFASSVCVDQSSAQGGERVLCALQSTQAHLEFEYTTLAACHRHRSQTTAASSLSRCVGPAAGTPPIPIRCRQQHPPSGRTMYLLLRPVRGPVTLNTFAFCHPRARPRL